MSTSVAPAPRPIRDPGRHAPRRIGLQRAIESPGRREIRKLPKRARGGTAVDPQHVRAIWRRRRQLELVGREDRRGLRRCHPHRGHRLSEIGVGVPGGLTKGWRSQQQAANRQQEFHFSECVCTKAASAMSAFSCAGTAAQLLRHSDRVLTSTGETTCFNCDLESQRQPRQWVYPLVSMGNNDLKWRFS
jgi:hypothetical protein